MRRLVVIVACAQLVVVAAACIAVPTAGAASKKPQPAGPTPSPIATAVCDHKDQHQIAEVLGLNASVGGRTWVNHKYSCRYRYKNGWIELSVQELSSWSQTIGYYRGLKKQLGDIETLGNLGQGAFRTAGGDVVVRKDWKVLLVDVSDLPPEFGIPPDPPTDVAYTVADVILGCWAGD